MTKTHILSGLCLLTIVLPSTALAYLSPEEVLTSPQNQMYFDPPPSPRDTAAVQAQQQSSDAALRAEQQAALVSSSSSSAVAQSSSEDLHGAAPDQNSQLQQLIDALNAQNSGSNQSEQDLVNQRILARIKANQLAAQSQIDAQAIASQQSLHSGAPLAQSGPGLDLVLGVLAIAGVWTFWRARRMEKAK
ncbi:MAG TPA: hypothetical protein VHA78_01825 [Candidatus Peribacteraceae bacterium]|nr:hypothetical protein [Candidatus Peribacteraceae bacterium]